MNYHDFTADFEAVTIKEIRAAAGISRAAFAREYGIPLRTLEDWEAGTRTPPPYVLSLLAYAVHSDFPQKNSHR